MVMMLITIIVIIIIMILTCQHQMTWSQGASSSLPHCGSKEYSHPHDIYGGKISLGGDGSRGRDIDKVKLMRAKNYIILA